MTIDREKIMELEALDPEDLVSVLGLSSEQIIRAFPGHVYDYATVKFDYEDYDEESVALETLEDLETSGFSILDLDPEDS